MVDSDQQNDKNDKKRPSGSEPSSFIGDGDVIPSGPDLSSVNSHVQVKAKPGESAESLIRRFRHKVRECGIMDKLEEIRFYEKPSKRKQEEEKIRQKKIARAQKYNRW